MPNQIIPLDNAPNQSFEAPLNVDGGVTSVFITLRYNEIAQYWAMTIQDINGNLLLDSVPFLTGDNPADNILGQFAYLEIGSALIFNASQVPIDHPNNTDLGTDFLLIWSDTPAA